MGAAPILGLEPPGRWLVIVSWLSRAALRSLWSARSSATPHHLAQGARYAGAVGLRVLPMRSCCVLLEPRRPRPEKPEKTKLGEKMLRIAHLVTVVLAVAMT